MTPQELRIGNWILYKGVPCELDLSDFSEMYNNDEFLELFVRPIPLTEEWLLRCGFEKINHINVYSFYSLSKSKLNKCHIDIYDTYTNFMGYMVSHCEFLHQLQNLYFALTNKELYLKL